MLLSRTIHHITLKRFKCIPIFIRKELSSHGPETFKFQYPLTYPRRIKCVYPVRITEPVRFCSSASRTTLNSEQISDGPTKGSESESAMDIHAITGGDVELEKRLKIFILEKDVLKQEGFRVPTHMRNADWKELLKLPSRSSRKKFLNFLFSVEKKKENRKKKKENRVFKGSEEQDSEICGTGDRITYGFQGSTIFLRVYETTMNSFYNYNAIRAMMFGQKIVFDCSYDPHMTLRESKNCAKQLMIAFADNRLHPEPFDLYLTGGQRNCPTLTFLNKHIPTMYEDTFPLTVTEKSYLELFPKEKLVYLTPHCREELLEYDHDAVYIIGSMVDKVNNEPLSLAKAKREGLKMAKLPLDRYLEWGSGGGKSLTLNQMLKILLDRKHTGDWQKSLVHVPQRKLVRESPVVKPFKQHFPHSRVDIKSLMS